jgi:hypothetical protein
VGEQADRGTTHLLGVLENVSVIPKENKITLVVKRHHTAPNKLWALGEQCVDHPAHLLAESRVEVVQNHLVVSSVWAAQW